MVHTNLSTVSIVGRPNVGKSTLFNRIIGRRKAVVHETSGTTRDSVEYLCEKDDKRFRLIDTGGFLKKSSDKISILVKRQIEKAFGESDILFFVCDVKMGITTQDEELLPILRAEDKKVFLIVNKVDNRKLEDDVYDFYQLGLGKPYPVSAVHGRGVDELLEDLLTALNPDKGSTPEKIVHKIAITGRPNVGKSSFINTLLEEERVIVDSIPGTTRDSIDTYFRKGNDLYLLIDTAGIRHKRKVKEALDVYSMSRSREAIERSDVSFLLIDGYDGLRNDDVRIFNYILECGKCCILVVNKWDLVKNIQMADYQNEILRKTHTIASYPIIFASAKTGRNLLSCIDMVKLVIANSEQTIQTHKLNKLLEMISRHIVFGAKRRIKFYYMVQTSVSPPTFLIFVNNPRDIKEEHTNYIEGILRKEYMFLGTPIKIQYRGKR